MKNRLTIVSNRLPVTIKHTDQGFDVQPSIGGLATGLASYAKNGQNRWIGWPGLPSDDLTAADRAMITAKLNELNCYPVFLTKKQIDNFYNGYSNSVLWPVFHELSISQKPKEAWWQAYREVNQLFAEHVIRLSEAATPIWVHDYQLLLVPELLRRKRSNAQIGFFLHIPFPLPKHFAALKEAGPLIRGVFGSNLVGLHTPSYVKNLLVTASNLAVGTQSSQHTITMPSHAARVSDFPMGIDYAKFHQATKQHAVRQELRRLKRQYSGKSVILSVDRLDPTKGLYERLLAYQTLLEQTPSLRGKVTFVMLAVPSRTEIDEYKKLRRQVETIVQDINTAHGTSSWKPVDYLYESMPFEKVAALYQRADIAFIAPIKDGMNLVAKEYIASREAGGALILSSSAGAAEELTDAIMVNPKKPDSLVSGLHSALTMPKREISRRLRGMQSHLQAATVDVWARDFISAMKQRPLTVPLSRSKRQTILNDFKVAQKPLILLDYDGTLRPLINDPDKATPPAHLIDLLTQLSSRCDITIISGRSRADLERWFGHTPLGLVAEHGATWRPVNTKKWRTLAKSELKWQPVVMDCMEKYTPMVSGSYIEKKQWALVWHYRLAKPQSVRRMLPKLRAELESLSYDIAIKDGSKILEVSPADVNKGNVLKRLVDKHDFVLIAGDDKTDEDMFLQAPRPSYTVKVGPGYTSAKIRVASDRAVINLLQSLADT